MRLLKNCCLLLLILATAPSCGHRGPNPQSSAEAIQVLTAASEFYQGQPGIRVETRLEAEILDTSGRRFDGIPPLIEQRTLALQPGNRYLVHSREFRLASDGAALRVNRMLAVDAAQATDSAAPEGDAVRSTESDFYVRIEPSTNPQELGDLQVASLFGGPANLRIAGLLSPGLADSLLTDGATVTDNGLTNVDGQSARHLAIRQEHRGENGPPTSSMTELWIAAEGDPLLLKISHVTGPELMDFGRQQITAFVSAEETFGDWHFDAEEPEETFHAVPGSRRVAGLGQLLTPASPMLGLPAPAVELPLSDGSSTSMAELRGEGKIVILDFWATWCGPCLQELPFVVKLAEEYAKDGVALYAVNQGESQQAVSVFQHGQSFEFTAALDESGSISDQFRVSTIPHLCIVGRDGTVQAVHIGVGPDTEAAIRTELEALVAGHNIAADGLPD